MHEEQKLWAGKCNSPHPSHLRTINCPRRVPS